MDCFDRPQDIPGFNPFTALAGLVEAGSVVRCPEVVKACTRLTLGADWGLLTAANEKRIGPTLLFKLSQLHFWRVLEVDSILARWDDKFRRESTCGRCGTDPWEIFSLTIEGAMKWEGTRYIDAEAASDTSSEEGSDDDGNTDSGEESDQERDDHNAGQSDSESNPNASDDDDDDIDPRLVATLPCPTGEEPPQPSTSGFRPRQRMLKNYGPNVHILRVVHKDEFGFQEFKRRTMDVCPRCGWRFDGKDPDPKCLFMQDIDKALRVAREQIAALPESFDL